MFIIGKQQRSNNLRIRGLNVRSQDETKQVVADFCRTKLHLTDFDISSIDMAHLLTGRQSSTTGASAASTSGARSTTEPTVLVRFRQREVRDSVLRKRKTLKGTHISIVEDNQSNRVKNSAEVQTCWTWEWAHLCTSEDRCQGYCESLSAYYWLSFCWLAATSIQILCILSPTIICVHIMYTYYACDHKHAFRLSVVTMSFSLIMKSNVMMTVLFMIYFSIYTLSALFMMS